MSLNLAVANVLARKIYCFIVVANYRGLRHRACCFAAANICLCENGRQFCHCKVVLLPQLICDGKGKVVAANLCLQSQLCTFFLANVHFPVTKCRCNRELWQRLPVIVPWLPIHPPPTFRCLLLLVFSSFYINKDSFCLGS